MSETRLKKTTFKDPPEPATEDTQYGGSVPSYDFPVEPEIDEETRKRREVMRSELSAMTERDENIRANLRSKRNEERRRVKEGLQRERLERGVYILPDAAKSKSVIRKMVKDEEITALQDKMADIKAENDEIQSQIDDKLGITALPKGQQLVSIAEDFYHNKTGKDEQLPEHIRSALTTEELQDLGLVFELFDAKNKGYITAHDLKRMAGMLGFTAKKKTFKEMIDETPSSKRGRVNFLGFLDLVVKLQGEGPDHYDEMKQFFNLLDRGGKGYITFQDLRSAADELKLPLSNKALRDMLTEADPKGQGKVRLEDLIAVLRQSGTFKSVIPAT